MTMPDCAKKGIENTNLGLTRGFIKARTAANGEFSYEVLELLTGIDADTIAKYAQGKINIPLSKYQSLAEGFNQIKPGLAATFINPWLEQMGLKAIALSESPEARTAYLLRRMADVVEEEI